MKLILFLFFVANLFSFVQAQNKSFYSTLEFSDCKLLESKSNGGVWSSAECEGFGNYKLLNKASATGSVDVITPSNKKIELNLQFHFLDELSSVEGKAEWRLKDKEKPVAVIIPLTVHRPKKNSNFMNHFVYLFVVKLSEESACITDIVKPSKKQKSIARTFADNVSKRPCKKTPSPFDE
jgi:hypothetical protein